MRLRGFIKKYKNIIILGILAISAVIMVLAFRSAIIKIIGVACGAGGIFLGLKKSLEKNEKKRIENEVSINNHNYDNYNDNGTIK